MTMGNTMVTTCSNANPAIMPADTPDGGILVSPCFGGGSSWAADLSAMQYQR